MTEILSGISVVLCTAPLLDAERLARALLDSKLAACINIVDKVESLYFWEGEIKKEQEALMHIKTRASSVSKVIVFLEKEHPYEVPEIIAVPILEGSKAYLDWVKESVDA